MIAKIKRNDSLIDTISYNLKDESHIIDVHNLKGDRLEDYVKLMKLRAAKFEGRAKKVVAHSIISPSIEDGRKLLVEQWQDIGYRYLVRMGLDKHQSLCFLHEDKQHLHLHIVTNRIDLNGKIYRPQTNEILLSQQAGREIAREMGLKSIIKSNQYKIDNEGLYAAIKKDISEAKEFILKDDQPFNLEKFFALLETKGYGVKQFTNKRTGRIYGYSVEKDGNYIKSSSLGKSFTIVELENSQTKNSEDLKSKIKMDLNCLVDDVNQVGKPFNEALYFDKIRALGYNLQTHTKRDDDGVDTGYIHGYSVGLDDTMFRASELDRNFTLSKLRAKPKELSTSKSLAEQKKIIHDLSELTTGVLHSTKEDYYSALGERGYKVQQRFQQGEPVGYTLVIGRRSYPDHTLQSGEFSLVKLMERNVVNRSSVYQYPKRKAPDPQSFSTIVEESIKEQLTNNLNTIVNAMKRDGERFSSQKFFSEINELGYQVKPFYQTETGSLRGYAIGDGKVFYNASELGKRFTLKSLEVDFANEVRTITKGNRVN